MSVHPTDPQSKTLATSAPPSPRHRPSPAMSRRFPPPPFLPALDHRRASAEQDHGLRRLLAENRRLTAGVADLHLEVAAALRHLRSEEAAAARTEAEWAAEIGCLRKRAARLAAEVGSLPALEVELSFVRAAVERGAAEKRELEEKRLVLKAELDEVRDKGLHVRSVEKDIDLLKQEIKRGRFDLLNFSAVSHSYLCPAQNFPVYVHFVVLCLCSFHCVGMMKYRTSEYWI